VVYSKASCPFACRRFIRINDLLNFEACMHQDKATASSEGLDDKLLLSLKRMVLNMHVPVLHVSKPDFA